MFRSILITGLFLTSTAIASPSLYELGLNINGEIFSSYADGIYTSSEDIESYFKNVKNVNTEYFDFATGLGTISVNYSRIENDNAFCNLFLNLDMDYENFESDIATINGATLPGLTYSVGDPISVFNNYSGSAMDNFNSATEACDIAIALGWNTFIPEGHHGIVDFLISADKPTTGFYIAQSNGSETVYISSSHSVPEPASLVLLLSGLTGLGFLKNRRKNKVNFIA